MQPEGYFFSRNMEIFLKLIILLETKENDVSFKQVYKYDLTLKKNYEWETKFAIKDTLKDKYKHPSLICRYSLTRILIIIKTFSKVFQHLTLQNTKNPYYIKPFPHPYGFLTTRGNLHLSSPFPTASPSFVLVK